MRTYRRQIAFTVVWIVGALLFVFGRPALFNAGGSGTTATPAAAGIAVLGSDTHGTDLPLRSLEQRARTTPGAAIYAQLAAAYLQRARQTADVTAILLADRAATHALALDPRSVAALTTAAAVRLASGDARGAAALAEQALRLRSDDTGGEMLLGDADLELGDYAGAIAAYQRLVDLQPGPLSYTRAARIHWLYADPTGALHLLRMALADAHGDPATMAWCQIQIGDDYFALGSPIAAELTYRSALRLAPSDVDVLRGLARLYAGEGRYQMAITYDRQIIARAAQPRDYIALGDIYAYLGRQTQAQEQYARAMALLQREAASHIDVSLDLAQFYADHDRNLPDALRLARAEAAWRHDVRTMDVLAWALYKNHDFKAALVAEKQALRLRTGTHDAGYYYHMGLIYRALGDTASATAYLHGALVLNPYFDLRQEPLALTTLRTLGLTRPAQSASGTPSPDGSHVSVGVTTGN